jgi:hypothetical protein
VKISPNWLICANFVCNKQTRNPWTLPRYYVDGVVKKIWSPIAGKNQSGRWVGLDGKPGLKALTLEIDNHWKYQEGNDTIKEEMMKKHKLMGPDMHFYTAQYLDDEKKKKKEKEKHRKSKIIVVSASSSSSAGSAEKHKKKKKVDQVEEAGVDLPPDPVDSITEFLEKIDIEDPNWVSPSEYHNIPSDMGAKGGDDK